MALGTASRLPIDGSLGAAPATPNTATPLSRGQQVFVGQTTPFDGSQQTDMKRLLDMVAAAPRHQFATGRVRATSRRDGRARFREAAHRDAVDRFRDR